MSGLPKRWMARGVLWLGMLPGATLAEALPDPTKPPAEVAAPAAAASSASGLQSVLIAPRRRAAIINGQTVELGEKYGEARLVEVSERGVVLRGPQGRQVLTLFPGVEMKQAVPAAKPAAKNKLDKSAARHAGPREEK